jgi:hypothetical protein
MVRGKKTLTTLVWMIQWGLRLGSRRDVVSAISTATNAVTNTVDRPQSHTQIFNVKPPITVYVRGSNCRVTVQRSTDPKVILRTDMRRSFGLELAAEQDDAGIYIVAKQKRVVGALSRADFAVAVPAECHLVFHLTPGDVVLEDIDGMVELPLVELTRENQ